MNRREFGRLTTVASAMAQQILADRGTDRAAAAAGRIPEAAGLITEMVFLDDCVRIGMYDRALPAAAKVALTAHPDFVRNGALWPSGGDSSTSEKFALAAGRACSRALERERQPNSAEARLYQDIAVLRDLAAKGGCNADEKAPVGDLLDVLHVRRRLGLHTLNPDENIQAWLEGIVTWWRDERDLRAALAAAYTTPDARKVRELVTGFYNPTDALIRLARDFQFGEVAPEDALGPALEQARGASRYARAMAMALAAIRDIKPPA
jgi:hypothetical protein